MRTEVYEQIETILLECGIEEDKINSKDFISEDVLDSLTMAEIIIAIEDVFKIEIDAEEIIPDNFMNIYTICELTEKYFVK